MSHHRPSQNFPDSNGSFSHHNNPTGKTLRSLRWLFPRQSEKAYACGQWSVRLQTALVDGGTRWGCASGRKVDVYNQRHSVANFSCFQACLSVRGFNHRHSVANFSCIQACLSVIGFNQRHSCANFSCFQSCLSVRGFNQRHSCGNFPCFQSCLSVKGFNQRHYVRFFLNSGLIFGQRLPQFWLTSSKHWCVC